MLCGIRGQGRLAWRTPRPSPRWAGPRAGPKSKFLSPTYTTQVAGRSILTIAQVPLTHLPGLPA